jgi:cation-transporting ATPase 13A1
MTVVPGDELVQGVSLHVERHWLLHSYVCPFVPIYATWVYAWFVGVADLGPLADSPEAGIIALVVVFLAQVLVVLTCHWSVHFMAWSTCFKVTDPTLASVAKFVPTANNGSAELVKVHKGKAKNGSGLVIWCIFQKLKYVWDENKKAFRGLEFPTNKPYKHYLEHTGSYRLLTPTNY